MSADNILVVVEHNQRIRVFDLSFSRVSSYNCWKPDQPTDANIEHISEVIGDMHKRQEVWSSIQAPVKKAKQWRERAIIEAEAFCRKYEKKNIVEYGYEMMLKA